MGCAAGCVRALFLAFNLVFFILGCTIFGIGVYSRVQNDSWKDVLESETYYTTANLFIASGVLMAMIGFLGCCGAWRRVQWMLFLYAALIILIFALEIAAGIYAYVKKDDVEEDLTSGLKKGVRKTYGKEDMASKNVIKAIDWFQQTIQCCGAEGPKDWKKAVWYKSAANPKKSVVPASCCKNGKKDCVIKDVDSKDIFSKGCVAKGKEFAKKNIVLIGGVGIGIAVIEIFGVCFALCLRKAFKDEESKA